MGENNQANYTPFIILNSIIWVIYIGLFIQHHLRASHLPQYQAIFLRIMFVFPFSTTITTVFALYNQALLGEFIVSFLEGYIFVAFFGLLIGWGWMNGDVYTALLTCQKYPNKIFAYKLMSCGPWIKDGKRLLGMLWWQAGQIMFLKPLLTLAKYILDRAFNANTHNNALLLLFYSVVPTISVFVASMAIFRPYRCFHHFLNEEDPASKKGFLMKGLMPFRKFLIVKLLIFFLIANSMFVINMIPDILPVPDFLCNNESEYCQHVYLAFIFSVECLIMIIPGALWFKSRQSKFPTVEDEMETDSANTHSIIYNYFRFWDVWTELLQPPVNYSGYLPDVEKNDFRTTVTPEDAKQQSF